MKTEVSVAIISAAVSLVCSGIAFWSQQKAGDAERRTEELKVVLESSREASGLFRQEQLRSYLEASRLASKIANLPTGGVRDAAIQEFSELYWGNLAVFEDRRVEAAMVGFKKTLSSSTSSQEDVALASLALAHACRDSLEEAWGVDLGPLGNLRESGPLAKRGK